MSECDDCRVISIQSHVVSGYVGNKSATFPLQVLGFEVDAINSVQFSNHTGYRVFKGQILTAPDLADIYAGVKSNDLNKCTHLLTGYIGSVSFLEEVKQVILDLKQANPNLIYVCDPVLGDNGEWYVPKELLPVYCNTIIPLADIVTPNQFEAELLTGIKITSIETAVSVIQRLHEMGVKTVVISSMEFGSDDVLIQLASRLNASGTPEIFQINIPKLKCAFTGTGDLFAALLLAWLHRHPNDLKLVCEKVLSTMLAVLNRTVESSQALAGPGAIPSPAQRELRLIQSKADIENPKIVVEAFPLTFESLSTNKKSASGDSV